MSTWMVVEDEADVYDTLLALLNIWSIDGIAFTNGTDAINWIDEIDAGEQDTDNLPELALLDIRLPGASGPEVGARLRQSPIMKNITVVLTTAYYASPSEEKEMMDQAQADAWIAKPFPSPRDFRKALQDAINHRRTVAAKQNGSDTDKKEDKQEDKKEVQPPDESNNRPASEQTDEQPASDQMAAPQPPPQPPESEH